jgi:glycosyltransferase involved in cell wall biosynthesis
MPRQLHILFLSDNFPPETNAPATRTFEHTRRWVRAGALVTVLTTAPNFPAGKLFPGYRNRLFQREWIDGVETVRVWTYITANEGVVRRTLDYVSFMLSGFLAALFMRCPDVIVCTSPQFFTACAAYMLSIFKRRPFVFELRDLWPDSILAVGAMPESRVIRLLKRLEYFLYRKATRIVSVTNSFKSVLASNGIPAEKIAVVRNGADLATFTPGPKPGELVTRHSLEGKFVAAYIGTVGMAHGLATILDAAAKLAVNKEVAFVLVGDGAERSALEAEARRRGLSNIVFVGRVNKDEVRRYWRLADVAVVLLKDRPVFRHVLPSKIFEAMATARPIVLGVLGESAELLKAAGAGIVIKPESADALADAIARLAADPEEAVKMGANGRRFVETAFDRDELAAAMLEELRAVAGLAA